MSLQKVEKGLSYTLPDEKGLSYTLPLTYGPLRKRTKHYNRRRIIKSGVKATVLIRIFGPKCIERLASINVLTPLGPPKERHLVVRSLFQFFGCDCRFFVCQSEIAVL